MLIGPSSPLESDVSPRQLVSAMPNRHIHAIVYHTHGGIGMGMGMGMRSVHMVCHGMGVGSSSVGVRLDNNTTTPTASMHMVTWNRIPGSGMWIGCSRRGGSVGGGRLGGVYNRTVDSAHRH